MSLRSSGNSPFRVAPTGVLTSRVRHTLPIEHNGQSTDHGLTWCPKDN